MGLTGPVCVGLLAAVCGMGAACGSADSQAFRPPDAASIRVLERGTDKPGAFCADFDLTSEDVARFFERATLLTADELHDEFDWLPCYVRGNLADDGGEAIWKIRAGGTATLTRAKGDTLSFGCRDCREEFGVADP